MSAHALHNKTNEFDCGQILEYYKEFKKNRSKWVFSDSGKEKKNISKTDCDSANSIFKKCELKIRIKLSDDRKTLLITK